MTTTPGTGADSDEASIILRALTALVEPLAALFPGESEVVLHDLRLLPHSIVAVAGDLTGRTVGGPATDLLLRAGAKGVYGTSLGYRTQHPDGRTIRGSTMIVRDSAGTAIAALCLNNDTTRWELMAEVARSMLPWIRPELAGDVQGPDEVAEEFLRDVDEFAQRVLAAAISSVGVPVDLMQKRHKVTVVQGLQERGFFLLKESVETAAQALGVTRFTVYNYLNEINGGPEDSPEA